MRNWFSTPAMIVHGFAAIAGGVGLGMSLLPGSDAGMLAALQGRMVMALAEHYRAPIAQSQAAELLLTLAAGMAGRRTARALATRLPVGWRVVSNASTAAALTAAIGWAAITWFERQRDEAAARAEGRA